ncbi:hypothetical protein LCGC14_1062520 [marine sediment metagenome]|uniref:Glycosyltransferase 2-like domain-containing protein n=1 Tax=marine sediment metagenome TaxID=412755 RepID=A0A0F9MQB9_9ZZZZ
MLDLSVILPLARDDFPIIGLPSIHVLEPTFHSLETQTFKDFELVVVDALYPQKREWIEAREWSFPVKYVPVHPNHRFWLDRGMWNVCGQLNTGILYVEGELIVRIDDCSEFGEDFLQRFWDGYQSGYFPLAMHMKYLKGKPARYDEEYRKEGHEAKYSESFEKGEKLEILKRLYGEDGLVRDTRYQVVKARGGRMIAPPDWYYGYSSASLEALLKINGYDELFDGNKSLEDADAGSRLTMAGYGGKFLLDIDHQVIEHEHKPIPESLIARGLKPIKCNWAIYLLNRRKRRWRANSDNLTEEDLEFIRLESLKPPCSPNPDFYDENCEGELWKLWASNQPIFDLRVERLEI